MRALLLVNRAARKGDDLLGRATGRLVELGFDLVEESAEDPGTLPEAIRRHRDDVRLVIVGGGDGTLAAAAPGLVDTDLPLGILPLGTANNLARTLEIPSDVEAACRVIADGSTRRIDVGIVNGRYFFNTASLGLSTDITEQLTDDVKKRWGTLAYGITALGVARRSRPFRAEIRWDEGALTTRAVQIVVGNGRHYGTALTVAEDARIDDAALDLYTIGARPWWRLALLLPALKRGSHGEARGVRTVRARSIDLRTDPPHDIDVDGELVTRTPAAFRVLPRALAVFVPASTNGERWTSP